MKEKLNKVGRIIYLILGIFCIIGMLVGIINLNIPIFALYAAFTVLFLGAWKKIKFRYTGVIFAILLIIFIVAPQKGNTPTATISSDTNKLIQIVNTSIPKKTQTLHLHKILI